jgi:hypothetical protein
MGDGFRQLHSDVSPTATTADPVITAAGDLVCAPGYNVTRTRCQHKAVSTGGLPAREKLRDGRRRSFDIGKWHIVTLIAGWSRPRIQAHPKKGATGAVSSTGVAEIVVGTGGRSVNPKR